MQRAVTFFYVSLGILALAGAFHFGAETARGRATTGGGQLTSLAWGDLIGCTALFATDTQGTFYVDCGLGGNWEPAGQLPGGAVEVFPFPSANLIFVALANGDIYTTPKSQPGAFTFHSNVFSGLPVQAEETTWGRIKAERR